MLIVQFNKIKIGQNDMIGSVIETKYKGSSLKNLQ